MRTRRTPVLTKRLLIPLTVVAAALGAGFGAGYWYAHRGGVGPDAFPVLGMAPRYTLTNQRGQRVDSARFRGKVQVVAFLFPYCTEYCPLIAAHLKSAEQALAAAGLTRRVQFVAFNVDPEDTGTADMMAFLREYGWNPKDPHMQFLTGAPKTVRSVVTGGFGVDYQKVPEALAASQTRFAEQHDVYVPPPQVVNRLARERKPDYDVTHNDVLVLVDPRGRIRHVYAEADRVSDQALVAAVRRLLGDGAGG